MANGPEAKLQKWIEHHARNDGIGSIIQGVDELQALRHTLSDNKRAAAAVNDALIALGTLAEPKWVSAGENLKVSPRAQYKPDLLLHCPNSGRWVIIELKAQHQVERQAVTEVLAYAESIAGPMHNAPIAIVIASTDWRPLLQAAVREQLGRGRYPLVPLHVTPSASGEDFTLRVHNDLFRQMRAGVPFDSSLFVCTTSSFFERPTVPAPTLNHHVIERRLRAAVEDISREGDRKGYSGLAILWRSAPYGRPVWHITVCAIDPNRLAPDLPPSSPIMQYLAAQPWPSSLSLDVELLSLANLDDLGCMQEFNGCGDWTQAQRVFNDEGTGYLAVASWGEIRDRWGTEANLNRMQSAGTIAIEGLNAGHPVQWVPHMDAICGEALTLEEMTNGLGHYKLGKMTAKVQLSTTWGLLKGGDRRNHRLHALARLLGFWHVVHEWANVGNLTKRPPRIHFNVKNAKDTMSSVKLCLDWTNDVWEKTRNPDAFAFHIGVAHVWAREVHAPDDWIVANANSILTWPACFIEKLPDDIGHAHRYLRNTVGDVKHFDPALLQSDDVCHALVVLERYARNAGRPSVVFGDAPQYFE